VICLKTARREASVPSALPPPQSMGTGRTLPCDEGLGDQSYHQPMWDFKEDMAFPEEVPALMPLGVKPAAALTLATELPLLLEPLLLEPLLLEPLLLEPLLLEPLLLEPLLLEPLLLELLEVVLGCSSDVVVGLAWVVVVVECVELVVDAVMEKDECLALQDCLFAIRLSGVACLA